MRILTPDGGHVYVLGRVRDMATSPRDGSDGSGCRSPVSVNPQRW